MDGTRNLAVSLALACLAAAGGCAGRDAAGVGNTPDRTLTPAPAAGALAFPDDRIAADLTESLILGTATELRSGGAVDNGTAVELDATAAATPEYAVYRFNSGTDAPDSVSVLLEDVATTGAFIGLANYGTGRWNFFGPYTKQKTLAIDGADFISPAGNIWVAVFAPQSNSAQVNALSVRTLRPGNVSPVAILSAPVTNGPAPLLIEFDGAGSVDPDGTIIEYAWDFDDNGSYEEFSDTPSLSHLYTVPTAQKVTLRVTDDQFARATTFININVTAPVNQPPTADFVHLGGVILSPPCTYHFHAGLSTDNDGSIERYEWDFDGDGYYETIVRDPEVAHTFQTGGTYNVELQVTDDGGATAKRDKLIRVNNDPDARLTVDTASAVVVPPGTMVFLDGSSSSDHDGNIADYQWDLDGNGSFNQSSEELAARGQPTESINVGAEPRQLFITLNVLDNDGGSVNATVEVTVTGWTAPALEVSGNFASMKVVNGRPAVSFSDGGNLYYASSADTAGSSWSEPDMLSGGGVEDTSLALINGLPAVAYRGGGKLRYIRATNAAHTHWSLSKIIDGGGDRGRSASLAFVNGRPAVSYYDETPGTDDLRYISASDENGTVWDMPVVVDAIGDVGRYGSLLVANGRPAIAYSDTTNSELQYVRALDADGTAWDTPLVLDSSAGFYPSAIIVAGRPAVSYQRQAAADLCYVIANDMNGDGWAAPVVVDSSGDDGAHSSLAVVDGLPAISYVGGAFDALKYVRAADVTGGVWGTPDWILPLGGFVVDAPTALVSLGGRPGIAYHNGNTGDVEFVSHY